MVSRTQLECFLIGEDDTVHMGLYKQRFLAMGQLALNTNFIAQKKKFQIDQLARFLPNAITWICKWPKALFTNESYSGRHEKSNYAERPNKTLFLFLENVLENRATLLVRCGQYILKTWQKRFNIKSCCFVTSLAVKLYYIFSYLFFLCSCACPLFLLCYCLQIIVPHH